MSEIELLGSEVVYQNRWMTVREDRIRRQTGSEGIYGVVEKQDFVAILPIDEGVIHLVEQYRYPVKQRYWEIPQGSWESDPEADPSIVAMGELREETGLLANRMTYIGHTYQAYGYSNQGCHIYLASDFSESVQDLDDEEQGLITQSVSLAEFEAMIINSLIKDITTINAYGLAKLKGLL